MKLELNHEWSELMRQYDRDHQDPRNRLCHMVGVPMIAASFPIGMTIVGLPLAVGLFTTGWGFQFAGHVFEGSDRLSCRTSEVWSLAYCGGFTK